MTSPKPYDVDIGDIGCAFLCMHGKEPFLTLHIGGVLEGKGRVPHFETTSSLAAIYGHVARGDYRL